MQRVACFFESTCIAKACNDIAFIIICVTGGTICQIIGRVAIGMKDILIKYNIGACDVFQLEKASICFRTDAGSSLLF